MLTAKQIYHTGFRIWVDRDQDLRADVYRLVGYPDYARDFLEVRTDRGCCRCYLIACSYSTSMGGSRVLVSFNVTAVNNGSGSYTVASAASEGGGAGLIGTTLHVLDSWKRINGDVVMPSAIYLAVDCLITELQENSEGQPSEESESCS